MEEKRIFHTYGLLYTAILTGPYLVSQHPVKCLKMPVTLLTSDMTLKGVLLKTNPLIWDPLLATIQTFPLQREHN